MSLGDLRTSHLEFWKWVSELPKDQEPIANINMYEGYKGIGMFGAMHPTLEHFSVSDIDTKGGKYPNVLIRTCDTVAMELESPLFQ